VEVDGKGDVDPDGRYPYRCGASEIERQPAPPSRHDGNRTKGLRAGEQRSSEPAEPWPVEPSCLDDPVVQEPGGAGGDQTGEYGVRQEMTALCDPGGADEGAEAERARRGQATPAEARGQEGKPDQRERHGTMPGDEAAISGALSGRLERRGESFGTAELDDLCRPRPAPMVLEDRVRQQAGAERDVQEQEQAPAARARKLGHAGDRERREQCCDQRPGDDRHDGIGEAERRPSGEEETAIRRPEKSADPEIDSGEGGEQQGGKDRGGEPEPAGSQPGLVHDGHSPRSWSSARMRAPADPVSSRGG